jgi:hypothetical protein
MSVSTVITLGYGSFGSPSFVTRLGFGSGLGTLEHDYAVDAWTVLHAQDRPQYMSASERESRLATDRFDRLSIERGDLLKSERWDRFSGDRGDA